MGTYLSTPITEKCEESGESLECPDVPCAWGVVDMQGWRKSMEDAHVAVTDISLPSSSQDGKVTSDAKVFGVFDGHGGAEVARFCGLYLVSVLTQQETWKNGVLTQMKPEDAKHLDGTIAAKTDIGQALRSTFHALDRMVDDMNRR
jgi:serine/threonine protein phosphatase PrpC